MARALSTISQPLLFYWLVFGLSSVYGFGSRTSSLLSWDVPAHITWSTCSLYALQYTTTMVDYAVSTIISFLMPLVKFEGERPTDMMMTGMSTFRPCSS